MTNVLILGAGGQIAQHVVRALRSHHSIHPTLFLRDTNKLASIDTARMQVVEGDAGNPEQLLAAMKGAGVKRLVFIASLGVYDEVPRKFSKWNAREIGSSLGPYKKAADLIEASGLERLSASRQLATTEVQHGDGVSRAVAG